MEQADLVMLAHQLKYSTCADRRTAMVDSEIVTRLLAERSALAELLCAAYNAYMDCGTDLPPHLRDHMERTFAPIRDWMHNITLEAEHE